MEQKSGWKKYLQDKRLWVVVGIVVVAVAAWAGFMLQGSAVSVTALSVDENGAVAPDSAFLIEVESDSSPDELEGFISTEPAIAWELSQDEEVAGRYTLTPLRPLEANSSLVLTVKDKSFPFTVQNKLIVISSFPKDGAVDIPVRGGVEFVFNTRSLAIESFREAFSISPKVEGDFSVGEGRFTFYSMEEMKHNAVYTVRLDGSLTTEDGAVLGEELSISFTTISTEQEDLEYKFQISDNGVSLNSLSDEAPVLQTFIDSEIVQPDQTVAVRLYTFPGWESYRDALWKNSGEFNYSFKNFNRASIDVSGLNAYASFELEPIKLSTDDRGYDAGQWALQFPEALPKGWYAAEFDLEVNDVIATRQLFLQVSDLSVFYMALDDDLLVWLNDASTGQPIEDARVELKGDLRVKGVTGADGILHAAAALPPENSQSDGATMFTISAGDEMYVDADFRPAYYPARGEESKANLYMSYLFTDRPIYHTTDTVQVWGMLRPRVSDTPLPEELSLILGADMASAPVTLQGDGTFTATLTLENATSSYWSEVKLVAGEDVLSRSYLRVEDFVKPVYTATTAPEQPVYLPEAPNSTVYVELDVSTFDGTPVSAFEVGLNSWGGTENVGSGQFVSDKDGHVRSPLRIIEDMDTWYPASYSYNYNSSGAQQESFSRSGGLQVIHRDVMLTAKPSSQGDDIQVEIGTHQIDISGIKERGDLWEPGALKGAALSKEGKAAVHKVYYTKEKIGTRYDFITRTSVDSYRYERQDEVVDTIPFSTKNGGAVLTGLPRSDNEACYYLEVETLDSRGRRVAATTYLGYIYDPYSGYDDGSRRYQLVKESVDAQPIDDGQGGTYYPYNHYTRFGADEDVTFRLMENDVPLEAVQGRVLYSIAQDKFTETGLSQSRQLTLPFDEALVPNYILTGAYFDGKRIFALEDTYMEFDPAGRELEVSLTTDKERYYPADEIEITATVKDKATGKPAAGAAVAVSVADEAVFALEEQYTDILETIYRGIYYPHIRRYASYPNPATGGGAEKGGGGGGEDNRSDFKDTAFFAAGKTDDAGSAKFRFKLPDNITGWRLTSLALTEDNRAGNVKSSVAATKDFFVLPIVSEMLLAGDDLAVGAYGTGAAVQDSDAVSYRVTLKGEGVSKTMEVSSTLRAYAGVNFADLPEGDYTVTVAGQCGSYKDAVELPVSVVSSGVEISMVKSFDLKSGISVEPLRYPISMRFYTPGSKTYNAVFSSVLGQQWGVRADMRIARKFTAMLFEKQGAKWYDSAALEEKLGEIGEGSVFGILPYAQADIEVTVKARLAAPDIVGVNSVTGRSISDSEWIGGAKSAFYLAQALAGEKPQTSPAAALEKGENLDFVDKMYLVMTMAVSGDTEAAEGWYDQLVKPHIREITGIAGDTALYLDGADAVRTSGECTAAASMLATMLGADEAEGLVLWLTEKKSIYEPYLFEQMYYLTCFDPDTGEKSSFSYQRDGQAHAVELDGWGESLSFNRQQMAEADFQVLSGEVLVDVYYAGAPDQTADQGKKRIGFTKTVEPVGGGSIALGSLVKITLTPDLSGLDANVGDTLLIVDDYIPSGMRFEKYGYEDTDTISWYLDSRQGQRLHFVAHGAGSMTGLRPIYYYARCAAPGDYVVESAYITSASADTWGETGRSTVHIQ